MKQTISIAALLALAFAESPEDYFKDRPSSLRDQQVEREFAAYDYD